MKPRDPAEMCGKRGHSEGSAKIKLELQLEFTWMVLCDVPWHKSQVRDWGGAGQG